MPDDIQGAYYVSGSSLVRTSESEKAIMDDPRGFVHIWEAPKQWAKYIMGHDPTVGITGWSRATRTDGDRKTDNGAIEIFRVDAFKDIVRKPDGSPDIDPATKQPRFFYRDLQVAEFFAPIDPVESARMCNLLGRIYAGNQEDQCELIYESYPGPGMLTTQELMRLGYTNLWMWEVFANTVAEETSQIGWRSSRETQKVLWYRARRHLMERRVIVQSPWLLAEYANAVIDIDKMRAMAAYGFHDDLMQAANMAMWAGHKWNYDPERVSEPVLSKPAIDWQNQAPVLGERVSYKDAWADAVDNWD